MNISYATPCFSPGSTIFDQNRKAGTVVYRGCLTSGRCDCPSDRKQQALIGTRFSQDSRMRSIPSIRQSNKIKGPHQFEGETRGISFSGKDPAPTASFGLPPSSSGRGRVESSPGGHHPYLTLPYRSIWARRQPKPLVSPSQLSSDANPSTSDTTITLHLPIPPNSPHRVSSSVLPSLSRLAFLPTYFPLVEVRSNRYCRRQSSLFASPDDPKRIGLFLASRLSFPRHFHMPIPYFKHHPLGHICCLRLYGCDSPHLNFAQTPINFYTV